MAERLIRNHPQMVSLFRSTVKCRECEIFIGTAGRVSALHQLAPGLMERAMTARMKLSASKTPVPPSRGNLYTPSEGDAKVRGGWRRKKMLKRVATIAAIGVAARIASRQLAR